MSRTTINSIIPPEPSIQEVGTDRNMTNMRQLVQEEVQKTFDTNILGQLTPGIRFIARDEGCGMGEVLEVYEVNSVDDTELRVCLVYSHTEGISFFEQSSPHNKRTVDISWLLENTLVLPLKLMNSMILLENTEGNGSESQILPQAWQKGPVFYANAKNYHDYHKQEVQAFSKMFLDETNHRELILEENGIFAVQWCDYCKHFLWDGTPVPYPRVGTGYWFSNQYKYAVEQIIQRFSGKKVRICYSKIIYTGDCDDSIELESAMIGIIWCLNPARGIFGNIEFLGENENINHIPQEAFLTGFTIECMDDR